MTYGLHADHVGPIEYPIGVVTLANHKAVANDAEQQMATYLTDRGYAFEHEPDHAGTGKKPDFLVEANGQKIVCEVKAFTSQGLLTARPDGTSAPLVGSASMRQALGPIRNQLGAAAAQLSELRESGMPLVIVLANPAGAPIPFDSFSIMSVMYGDVSFEAAGVDTEGQLAGSWVAGLNGKFKGGITRTSALWWYCASTITGPSGSRVGLSSTSRASAMTSAG